MKVNRRNKERAFFCTSWLGKMPHSVGDALMGGGDGDRQWWSGVW